MKINKKELFKIAWDLAHEFKSFGQALKQAWKIIRLRTKMMLGNVSFKFRKVNGEIREAIGTLNFTYEAKNSGKSSPTDSMVYMEVGVGIRSCKLVNIL